MKSDRRWLHVFALGLFATFGVGAKDAGIGCCGGGGNYPYGTDGGATDAAVDAVVTDAASDATPDAEAVDSGAD